MSVCIFIASNSPLKTFAPSQEYSIDINLDNGTIYDGDADDNYFLYDFREVADYTNKNYGVFLEWNYTEGRAEHLIEYIKNSLLDTDSVELWHVWLDGYYEFEERPFIHKKAVSVNELTTKHIKEINDSDIWNRPDKKYPNRPSFYCLTVSRS